jgi:membrane fusion protein, multidrug efflux system
LPSRTTPVAASAFLLLVLAAPACRRAPVQTPPPADTAVRVQVQPVVVKAVPRAIDVVGTLFGNEEATVSARTAGRVVEISRDVGDTVAADEVLARIDPTDYQLALAQKEAWLQSDLAQLGLTRVPEQGLEVDKVPAVMRARFEVKNAEARFKRGEAMFAEKPPLITEQEHADLRTTWDVASSAADLAATEARARFAQVLVRVNEVALARQELADATVRTPAVPGGGDGRSWHIARRLVAVGEYMREGTAMFRLVALDPIKFRADVPERFSAAVQKGMAASVSVAAFAQPFTGRITRIAPQIDAGKRTFLVEIQVDNADARLLPGGFARGAIGYRTDERVVFVPQDAIVVALGQSKVFTIKDGKAVEHKVATGVHDGAYIEIGGDLGGATEVITSGAARLAKGTAVTVAGAGQ